LTPGELQNIIARLEEAASKDKATFGIFQYGGGPDESYIKANKEGLMLYAIELLKAANSAEDIINDKEKSIIPLPFEEGWIDDRSSTIIETVEPVSGRDEPKIEKHPEEFGDKVVSAGCIVGIALILACIAIGFWTLAKWIF
jgi:hypothetical protein